MNGFRHIGLGVTPLGMTLVDRVCWAAVSRYCRVVVKRGYVFDNRRRMTSGIRAGR